MSAESQLSVELNSTSDNPVINVGDNDIHCGANFQAATVTSATEKTRLVLQSLGRMLFAQTSEMINHDLSNCLPPNLAADDPSLCFCLKGIDVNTAAYTSELGFLANPVSNHVQSPEMHNQAINSLGLLSARQTLAAVECLSLIAANCLYTGCQAVDLRTLHRTFIGSMRAPSKTLISSILKSEEAAELVFNLFWKLFEEAWYQNCAFDASERCEKASAVIATAILAYSEVTSDIAVAKMESTRNKFSMMLVESYHTHRNAFFRNPTTPNYLGQGTKVAYLFVRERLGVPMHRGLVEHPIADDPSGNVIDSRPKKTIGSWLSMIYDAVRDGSLVDEVLRFLALGSDGCSTSNGNGTDILAPPSFSS